MKIKIKKQIISALAVVLIIVGFAVGLSVGFINGKADNLVQTLNSKSFLDVTALGVIQNISGNDITINRLGTIFSVKMQNGAKVLSYIGGGNLASTIKTITLNDLKVGDYVTVGLVVGKNGDIAGNFISVLPSPQSGAGN